MDVERYKRLAVQQEKSITALQARNQETEARARDGAANADMVEQLRNERDQISMLVRAHPCLFSIARGLLSKPASDRVGLSGCHGHLRTSQSPSVCLLMLNMAVCVRMRVPQLKKRRFMCKELEFELLASQAALDAECELPDTATADAAIRILQDRLARLESRRMGLN